MDDWRLVWEELESRSSLGELVELLDTVLAQILPIGSGNVPSAIQSSLVTWRMNSSLSQALQ